MFLKINNPSEKPVHGGHCMPVAATGVEGGQPLGERGQERRLGSSAFKVFYTHLEKSSLANA